MIDKTRMRVSDRFKDHPLFNEMICGTNFGFLAKRGYYFREDVRRQPELMAKSGINWTTLNMNFCQDTYYSQKVYLDFAYSTGEAEILETVKRLHDNGVRVLFKPCLTSLDGAWMGNVHFPNAEGMAQIEGVRVDYWDKWSKSFIEAEKYFADLAERAGIDAMMIGAEYFGTEGQDDMWQRVIEVVRDRFSQPISYEFTFASRKAYELEWFKKLDFLSYSYYPPACAPNMDKLNDGFNPGAKDNPVQSVEGMMDYLAPRRDRIRSISERFDNLPIAFTEYGVRSAHGCVMQPYNFLWDSPYDGQEQADYMEASYRTFSDLDCWMGLFWWKWDETQHRPHYHGDPNGDRGFTIQGKPAEAVMRKWAQWTKEQNKKG